MGKLSRGMLAVAVGVCLPALALGADLAFKPCPDSGQSLRYEDGTALLFAQVPRAAMFVAVTPRDKRTQYVWLGVSNRGDAQFNITEESISASINGQPAKVMTLAERSAEVSRSTRLKAFGAALAAGMSGYAAGASGGQGSYSGNVYSNGTTATYSGTYTDPAAASAERERVRKQTARTNASIRAQNEASSQALRGRALVAQTLDPGGTLTGDVVVEIPKAATNGPARLNVTLSVADSQVQAVFVAGGAQCPARLTYEARIEALKAKLQGLDPHYAARLPLVVERVTGYSAHLAKIAEPERIAFMERLYWSTPVPAE